MLGLTGSTGAREGGRAAAWSRPEGDRRDLLARLSVMSLLEPGRPRGADSRALTEASAVARAWLDLVHSGRSASSWAVAAPALKQAVDLEEWVAALRALHVTLGRCRSRRQESLSTFESFPGLPPGPYVVIRFQSGFEERAGVIETVTTCRGHDGHWRAAAYFVR